MAIRTLPAMTTLCALFSLLALPATLEAQEAAPPFRYRSNGHAGFVSGACWHGYALVGAAGGAETFLWRGLTLGGDLAAQKFLDSPVFGIATTNVGFHFVSRTVPARFDPFLNFHIGAAFAQDVLTAAPAFGGGLNYWFRKRTGLRTEARFQLVGPAEGLLAFRIGLSFR